MRISIYFKIRLKIFIKMLNTNEEKNWQEYKKHELAGVLPILTKLGLQIDDAQPHISGERYLMQAVTTKSGRKLILTGHLTNNGQRVIIKVTSDKAGMRELEHDQKCRQALKQIRFAYQVFFSPKEILFTKRNGYTISVHTFIEQECMFLERPVPKQFSLALKAFKAQESAHATTYRHKRIVRKNFGFINTSGYLKNFAKFKRNIILRNGKNETLAQNLENAQKFLETNRETIEQYCGFLTHTDFVPHNIRISEGKIYLLDHSSLRFGNKYEGWARFLNFMTLYNQPLEKVLVQYVKDNRAPEELLSLKLMRIYRLGEIIWYYVNTLDKSSGNLHTLNRKRIDFWSCILEAVLNNTPVSKDVIENYKQTRDSLRGEEEKQRQKELH